MLHHQGKSNFLTIALQCQQRQKKERENAIPLGTILLCCSLKLHSLKCLAAELVDTEVPRDACEANKFNCQPGAASLCRRHNEPGENVKQGKMKQTLWSISCSNSWISNTSSELKWKTWLTSGAEQFSREEMEYQFGGGGGGGLRDIHKAHIWTIQFSWSTDAFSKLRLNYPIWQHHYSEDYYVLSRRFGLFIFSIVDDVWSAPQRAAQRTDFWQSMIHLLLSPYYSLTLSQINLKAEPDRSSRHMPYKQPLFLLKALFVLYKGFKGSTALLRWATI